jgi:hypothetical protein
MQGDMEGFGFSEEIGSGTWYVLMFLGGLAAGIGIAAIRRWRQRKR